MGRRLAGTVAIFNPETFTTSVFREGDEVPAWAASRIGDHLWAGATSAPAGDGVSEEPPRAGKGSGRDAWAAYAESAGVEFDEDATRDDIIAAVDASRD